MTASMTPHHHGPIELDGWDSSCLYAAQQEPDCLIVLVHGFWSKSDATWPKLDERLFKSPEYERCDILFWDYDSRTGQIPTEVKTLSNAIDAVFARGRNVDHPAQSKVSGDKDISYSPSYQRLVLVGYSLGGLMSRGALLNRAQQKPLPAWLLKLKLVLFAPAHLGAKQSHWLAYRPNDPLEWLKKIARGAVPPLDVLTRGSAYILGVQHGTEQLAAAGASYLVPSVTLFGSTEDWVEAGVYACDRRHKIAQGRKHEDVQRGDDTYLDAIDCILQALK